MGIYKSITYYTTQWMIWIDHIYRDSDPLIHCTKDLRNFGWSSYHVLENEQHAKTNHQFLVCGANDIHPNEQFRLNKKTFQEILFLKASILYNHQSSTYHIKPFCNAKPCKTNQFSADPALAGMDARDTRVLVLKERPGNACGLGWGNIF